MKGKKKEGEFALMTVRNSNEPNFLKKKKNPTFNSCVCGFLHDSSFRVCSKHISWAHIQKLGNKKQKSGFSVCVRGKTRLIADGQKWISERKRKTNHFVTSAVISIHSRCVAIGREFLGQDEDFGTRRSTRITSEKDATSPSVTTKCNQIFFQFQETKNKLKENETYAESELLATTKGKTISNSGTMILTAIVIRIWAHKWIWSERSRIKKERKKVSCFGFAN